MPVPQLLASVFLGKRSWGRGVRPPVVMGATGQLPYFLGSG